MFFHGKVHCAPLRHYVSLVPLFLAVCGSVLVSSCRSRLITRESVEVKVRQVGFDPFSNSPVIILQDKNGTRTMPIWIGVSEAQAIALQLQGTMPPRPLTHDLVKSILQEVGVEIDRVLVNDLKGSTYYARIHLINGTKAMEVDSRPSDAIALALRFHRPIFVDRTLFESTLASQDKGDVTGTKNLKPPMGEKFFGLTVQEMTDDLAEYFNLSRPEGILITDVDGETGTARLQRGDIIISVNGEKVRNISELRQKIVNKKQRVFTLFLRRDGEEISRPLSIEENVASDREESNE